LLADVPIRASFPRPAAYVELHIEQGPVLERSGVRLGAVTAIAGQRRLHVTIGGQAGHAGTVPMTGRADALCAAADLILTVERAARDVGDCVATVGWIVVEPNQTNIVPGAVRLRIDARAVDDARIAEIEARVRSAADGIAQRRGTPIGIELVELRAAAWLDDRLQTIVRGVCEALDPRCIALPSGAGHDAMCLAKIVPTAMIFVPSIGGHSHVAAEKTAPADLELGVEALAATLVAVDRDLAA
jgi:hydantoinase/carbamoylase family amidase